MTVIVGDCRDAMAAMAPGSVDAVVCDPPYELAFMNKGWDNAGVAFDPRTWKAALGVLKPGGHLLAFGGTRTYHRMTCAIEDAGFEIRDCLAWMYGSGFPKSLDVSKAIDKAQGVDGTYGAPKTAAHAGWIDRGTMRGAEGHDGYQRPWMGDDEAVARNASMYEPNSDAARVWQGWGTAAKPAWEPVIVAMKPLSADGAKLRANLCLVTTQLLTLLSAKDAERLFSCSPTAYAEACGSARWPADGESSTRAALSALTDTSRSESVITSSLNTVLSWVAILDDLLLAASMFTTETESSTTTALRTLNYCLSGITPVSIIQAVMNPPGSLSPVALAERTFAVAASTLRATRELSALALATEKEHTSRLGEVAPELSPVVVARKPLISTVAGNVLRHGTGALNIDASRIGSTVETWSASRNYSAREMSRPGSTFSPDAATQATGPPPPGRWPANVLLSHTDDCIQVGTRTVKGDGRDTGSGVRPGGFGDVGAAVGSPEPNAPVYGDAEVEAWDCVPGCAVAILDAQTGELSSGKLTAANQIRGGFAGAVNCYGTAAAGGTNEYEQNSGGASRFFYQAKASQAERNAGLADFDMAPSGGMAGRHDGSFDGRVTMSRNPHPTVKPISVMRWLVRLVTPSGGLVLDPFLGSGTTGIAAFLEGFDFVGIEQDATYAAVSEARIAFWEEHGEDGLRIVAERDALERRGQERRAAHVEAGQLDLFEDAV